MKEVVNKKYAKNKGDYKKVIATIESKGKCPFCPKNFTYHKKPTLKRSANWFITENSWPYKNTSIHLIILSKQHKEYFGELTLNDFRHVKSLANWAIKKFRIKGGALTIRFGDTDYTGATVCHIHFHLISPKHHKGKTKPVFFPIG